MQDKEALLDAINFMVFGETAIELAKVFDDLREMSHEYPVQLSGPQSIINPLLEMETQDPEKASRLRDLIDRKRADTGRMPLWPEGDFDVNDYQREYMKKKRDRKRLASIIENLRRGPDDQLKGHEREMFERDVYAKWMVPLTEKIDAMREEAKAAGRKHTNRAEVAAVRDAYWSELEERLIAEEKELRRKKSLHMQQE